MKSPVTVDEMKPLEEKHEERVSALMGQHKAVVDRAIQTYGAEYLVPDDVWLDIWNKYKGLHRGSSIG